MTQIDDDVCGGEPREEPLVGDVGLQVQALPELTASCFMLIINASPST